jgi:hypothetical protein
MRLRLLLARKFPTTAHALFVPIKSGGACVLLLTKRRSKALIQCYPSSENLRVHGAGNASSCTTGKGYSGMFCKTCGVHLLCAAADSEEPLKVVPLNLRAMHGVEWDELNVTKRDGHAEGD